METGAPERVNLRYVPPHEVAVVAERRQLLGSDIGPVLAHDDAQGRVNLYTRQATTPATRTRAHAQTRARGGKEKRDCMHTKTKSYRVYNRKKSEKRCTMKQV